MAIHIHHTIEIKSQFYKGDTGETGAPGPQGEPGPAGQSGEKGNPGISGKSAYQSAIDGGFTGTEEEFNAQLASLGDLGTLLDELNGEMI